MRESDEHKKRRAETNARILASVPRKGRPPVPPPPLPPLPDTPAGLTPIDTRRLNDWMTNVAKMMAAQHTQIADLQMDLFLTKVIGALFLGVLVVVLAAS